MSGITPVVEVFFGDAGTNSFTIEDPIKGQLDGSFGLVGADGEPTDIGAHAHSLSIRRGRSFELDPFNTGTCSVRLRNYDGRFLPADLDTDDVGVYGPDGIRPGRRCRVSIGGIVVFDGTVEDWDFDYERSGRVDAELVAEDALAALARTTFTEWTTLAQLPGARIEAVLDRNEVRFGANRSIDAGRSPLQSDLVSHGSNVRNYLELVAESDLGRLFAARDGVLTFRDRSTIAGAAVSFSFGTGRLPDTVATEGGAEMTTEDGESLTMVGDTVIDGAPISEIGVEYGSEALYTRVSVDREDGIAQSTTAAQSVLDDYGTRTLSLTGLLLDSDTASADMASFLLNAYSSPRYRFRRVSVILDTLSAADQATLLALDLGDVVTVAWTPVGMDAATQQTLVVEGITILVDHDGLAVATFDLSPRLQELVFVVEDATLGALDGTGVLSY